MSIADKLIYLDATKNLLREAINAAGGNLTQETPFREYAGGWLGYQSASLILDFSKQQYAAKDKVSMFPDRVGFEDIVTFTRSTGGGRFNAQGEYEWVGSGEPRIDYDPVTGKCRGLLIEEQRTNLLTYSSDFANAAWGSSIGVCTVTSNAATGPDGTQSADLLEFSGAANANRFQTLAVTAGSAYTLSFWLRSPDGMGSQTFRIGSIAVGVFATITVTEQWQRFSVTQTHSATANRYPMINSPSGNGSVLSWNAQCEQGAFATSDIPTTTSQVTRAADIASVNELSPWYNPSQGSFSIKAKGHTGEPLLTAGDASIIADSDELKEYQVSYSEDPQATQVDMGKGLIESIRYWPRETA